MQQPAAVRTWATVAVVAQVVFVLSWLAAGLWQGAAYSAVEHTISDLYAETAPHGGLLVVALTLCGLATVLFALLGLRPALRGAGWTATLGSVLLACSILGLGDLLSPLERESCRLADPGCTPADQSNTLGGLLDSVLSTAGLVLLIASGFFLAAAMRRLPAWRGLARRTRLGTVGLIVLVLAAGLLPGVEGLTERLLAAAAAAGVAALALATRRRADTPGG